MLSELLQGLVQSRNEAADDVLLEALRLGSEQEKPLMFNSLMRRKTLRGMSGIIAQYNNLPQSIQLSILRDIRSFHAALRECGRSADPAVALTAMKLIALGKQGKLTYLLSEGMHGTDEMVSKSAVEAMVALARWVSTETRRLQRGDWPAPAANAGAAAPTDQARADEQSERANLYRQLIEERGEIEQAVARAIDVHRGKYGQELLRAALLLADNPASKTFTILQTAKQGGQTAMIRRLQQVPDSEHVEAYLLSASHAGLRTHFGVVFSHIVEPPVMDALLRRTHWLKDNQLQLCMHQVARGTWWTEADLEKDLKRRQDDDAARVGEWIAASGVHDVVQDERLQKILEYLKGSLPGRTRLLRIAMRRPRGASVQLLRAMLSDPDERIIRMAAREFVRRRPAEYENVLIQLMSAAPDSVRRVISRSVGQVGFDHFWDRFDRMDLETRKAAGKATLKVLGDGLQRLERRMRAGPLDQRVKAMQIVQELEISEKVSGTLQQLCHDPHPKIRSKAVALLADLSDVPPETLLTQVLNDADPRVRANAIEVLEAKQSTDFVPLLTERARSSDSRERANAIKALHRMRVATASTQLSNMLHDERPEHRISAMWALRQIGFWKLLSDVGHIAKEDPDLKVRRYGMAVLRRVMDVLEQRRKPRAAG